MDSDPVRVHVILGPPDEPTHTYTPLMPRWLARDVCRDFAAGVEWEGRPVMRALIVP